MDTHGDLANLERLSFDALLAWLQRALGGKEALPRVVPDEPPEQPILRHERALSPMVRRDLEEACRVLVRRFVRQPEGDDEYVGALLRLARGLGLTPLALDLHGIASNEPLFAALPVPQQKSVLFTLLDLRAQLPAAFWQDLAHRHDGRFGVVAFSALLRQAPEAALALLAHFPDDPATADEVYVVLGQHGAVLSAAERDRLAAAARRVAARPQIRQALSEWADEAAPVRPTDPTRHTPLHGALAALAARRNKTFRPEPRSARL